jgi:hypothetical protein
MRRLVSANPRASIMKTRGAAVFVPCASAFELISTNADEIMHELNNACMTFME